MLLPVYFTGKPLPRYAFAIRPLNVRNHPICQMEFANKNGQIVTRKQQSTYWEIQPPITTLKKVKSVGYDIKIHFSLAV